MNEAKEIIQNGGEFSNICKILSRLFDQPSAPYRDGGPKFCRFHKQGLLPHPMWNLQNLGLVSLLEEGTYCTVPFA